MSSAPGSPDLPPIPRFTAHIQATVDVGYTPLMRPPRAGGLDHTRSGRRRESGPTKVRARRTAERPARFVAPGRTTVTARFARLNVTRVAIEATATHGSMKRRLVGNRDVWVDGSVRRYHTS